MSQSTPTKSKRIRLTRLVVATRADAESMLGQITAARAEQNGMMAALDCELTAVRQRFEGDIDALAKEIEQKTGLLQQWAEASAEEFAAGKKSIEFLHGRIGFRTGTPKLKLLSGYTWDKVKEALKRSVSDFLRVKEEVDKEAMLAAYAKHEIEDADLRNVGVKVVQEEAFFVEPKIEEGVV